jgi:hypothetical protein
LPDYPYCPSILIQPLTGLCLRKTGEFGLTGCGLGKLLQARLEGFAARRGFRGAVEYLFEDNLPMLKTFGKRGSYCGGILED